VTCIRAGFEPFGTWCGFWWPDPRGDPVGFETTRATGPIMRQTA